MRRILFHFLAAFSVLGGVGLAAPMTLKELEFLVRQRTPEAEILRDLAARRLIAPLDAAGEKQLQASGASPHLISQLKSGVWTLDPTQAQTELQRQGAAKQRVVQEVADAAARAEAITKRNNEISARLREQGTVQRLLRENLVYQAEGRLHPLDDTAIADVRVFVFLAASSSSGPSKLFTPKLVTAYRALKDKYPEFEVIFVSLDRDEFNMTEHMKTFNMPWPAVKFKGLPAEFSPLFGDGLPWLVITGDDGKPLSQNGRDQKFIDPEQILSGLEPYLAQRRMKTM